MSTLDPLMNNSELAKQAADAKDQLNAQTLRMVHWHFSDDTGCPFWLEQKRQLKFDALERHQVV